MINEATRRFIAAHITDDVCKLALQAKVPENVDLRAALVQIEGAQRLKAKAPRLVKTAGIEFPERLPLEQCSSEATAAYKRGIVERLVKQRGTMVDLTGGFGIDFSAVSSLFGHAGYVERNESLCALARNNFSVLGMENADVNCTEAGTFLKEMQPVDFVFIDPARRSEKNRKVVLLEDCSPDVVGLLPLLKRKCRFLMVKLSPMLDVSAAIAKLGNCREMHVVAVNGEMKEIVGVVDFSYAGDAEIVCSDIRGGETGTFVFRIGEERNAVCEYCDEIGDFLYESDAAVLKAGAFKLPAQRFGLKKLHPNTHLYTSNELNTAFMGKVFKIGGLCGFSKKELKHLGEILPKANVAVRNFPVPADELRHRLRIKDGGETYVFGTTLNSGKHVIIYGNLLSGKTNEP